MRNNINTNLIKSISKAVKIFSCFNEVEKELSFTSICRKTGMPKTTVNRLIRTLIYYDLIEKNEESNKYKFGNKIFRYYNILISDFDIINVAYPTMKLINKITKETVNLHLLHKNKRLCISQIKGTYSLIGVTMIGDEFPLYVGATGRALLAFQSKEMIDELISSTHLKKFTKNTKIKKEAINEKLEEVRKKGYSFSIGEREEGLCSVSAPICNYKGDVIAAITVSGPHARISNRKIVEYGELLIMYAKKISKSLF